MQNLLWVQVTLQGNVPYLPTSFTQVAWIFWLHHLNQGLLGHLGRGWKCRGGGFALATRALALWSQILFLLTNYWPRTSHIPLPSSKVAGKGNQSSHMSEERGQDKCED